MINKHGNDVCWENLWVPIPNTTNYQYDINLTEINPEPSEIYTDPEHNNTVLYYRNAPAIISGSYEYIHKLPFKYDIDPQKVGTYDKESSFYRLYTKSETWIEADADKIIRKANELTNKEDGPYQAAESINHFVYNYLEPKQIEWISPEDFFKEYGALATYKRGYGTCNNYALLFVALCRAAGIPARTVNGINFFEELLGEKFAIESMSHAWAEFYLPGYGWITVDPSQNEFAEVSNLRLVYSVGNNIIIDPPCNSPDAWYCHNGKSMSLGYTVPFVEENIIIEELQEEKSIYFPHIASNDRWDTEISVISKSHQELSGVLTAHDAKGNKISEKKLTLPGYGRRALKIDKEFSNDENIGYLIFAGDSSKICGYTKFYRKGQYRVAVPAVKEINSEDIYVPHIASNSKWWTGLALLNTTDSEKTLDINFSNGQTKQVVIAAGAHTSFNIKSLFGGRPQPDIESAVISSGSGIIGLELFSKDMTLSGVLLKDDSREILHFPHVASSQKWWTGLAAFNTGSSDASLIITPYTKSGIVLDEMSLNIGAGQKYLGSARKLGLPGNTAWLKISSSQPLNGLELFGTSNGRQLAGYSAVNISRKKGLFPKIGHEGWTGIAFVNTSDTRANIELSIYDDNGFKVSEKSISLAGHEKMVNNPENIFGGPITEATYMKFSSDSDVVGFQLNGSNDGMMLDGLPGM